jgi:hypothetical protein
MFLFFSTYMAFDTLIEPHQLTATLQCVTAVSRSLLSGGYGRYMYTVYIVHCVTCILIANSWPRFGSESRLTRWVHGFLSATASMNYTYMYNRALLKNFIRVHNLYSNVLIMGGSKFRTVLSSNRSMYHWIVAALLLISAMLECGY